MGCTDWGPELVPANDANRREWEQGRGFTTVGYWTVVGQLQASDWTARAKTCALLRKGTGAE